MPKVKLPSPCLVIAYKEFPDLFQTKHGVHCQKKKKPFSSFSKHLAFDFTTEAIDGTNRFKLMAICYLSAL